VIRANNDWRRVSEAARIAARRSVQKAVKDGVLQREPCKVCGAKRTVGHHARGYEGAAALDVDWLCAQHHAVAHARFYEGGEVVHQATVRELLRTDGYQRFADPTLVTWHGKPIAVWVPLTYTQTPGSVTTYEATVDTRLRVSRRYLTSTALPQWLLPRGEGDDGKERR
jgi:hypothetical protein